MIADIIKRNILINKFEIRASTKASVSLITSIMLNNVLFIVLLLQFVPVLSGHPGWFASVRGGHLSPHPSSVYPRALSNIAYAYGHIKDTEEDEEVINTKSTGSATTKKWSDEDYEEEDHFFHSLYHNNDHNDVVTNVSTKKTEKDTTEDDDPEDMVMFKKLNDKIFHRRRRDGGEEKKEGGGNHEYHEIANMKYGMTGLQDVIEDVSFFE